MSRLAAWKVEEAGEGFPEVFDIEGKEFRGLDVDDRLLPTNLRRCGAGDTVEGETGEDEGRVESRIGRGKRSGLRSWPPFLLRMGEPFSFVTLRLELRLADLTEGAGLRSIELAPTESFLGGGVKVCPRTFVRTAPSSITSFFML